MTFAAVADLLGLRFELRLWCGELWSIGGERDAMNLRRELTKELRQTYQRAGQELGYWASRFLQALKRKGGLLTVKQMLGPRSPAQRAGLDRMLDARRPDLTVEAVILRRKYRSLFTPEELRTARDRLFSYKKASARRAHRRENLFPDEVEPGLRYPEGALKFARVNAYERSPRARRDCIRYWGAKCAACGMIFEKCYGALGKGFIHVHHIKPLARVRRFYKVDPIRDLRPVCPNCHAMLHRRKKVLTVASLKARLARVRRSA